MRPLRFDGHPIKLISSCVRAPELLLPDGTTWNSSLAAPRDGDLVLVRCLASTGAYNQIEDLGGMPMRVYAGDLVLLVLATRRSGTNLIGEVPAGPLQAGDRLDLVAQGGLAARCTGIPAYYGASALPLEIVAFPASASHVVLNLDQAPRVPEGTLRGPRKPTLFVCGTSAEVGKTTAVCNLNLVLKARWPTLRTAAIKACGTGRSKDGLNYRAANYDIVVDFVDAGLPTTYNVSEARFRAMLESLLAHCHERADFVVVEMGGDFLEAQAPVAIEMMVGQSADCIMMVNDAMGAMEGLRRLRSLSAAPLLIGTFKQNLHALAMRLGVPPEQVADTADAKALERVLEAVLGHRVRTAAGAAAIA
jgi:hypothetical protein